MYFSKGEMSNEVFFSVWPRLAEAEGVCGGRSITTWWAPPTHPSLTLLPTDMSKPPTIDSSKSMRSSFLFFWWVMHDNSKSRVSAA